MADIDTITELDTTGTRELLLSHQSFVLTTHINPDGDAAGSEGALYYYLRARGKDVRIVNTSSVPEYLQLLDEDGVFVSEPRTLGCMIGTAIPSWVSDGARIDQLVREKGAS